MADPHPPPPATATELVTAEHLSAMGSGRRELIRGEVIEMTPAGGWHGAVAFEIGRRVANFAVEHRLGWVYAAETGFLLERNPTTVRAPDVGFVMRERVVETDAYFPGAPDLAVEVLSPTDTFSEVTEKVEMWLAHGTRQVWVVDSRRRRVKVYRGDRTVTDLAEEDTLDGADLLPGFRLPVRDCFPVTG